MIGPLQDNGMLDLSPFAAHLSLPGFPEQLEAEYISHFEVGGESTPPCPLYEGLCRQDEERVGVLMELLRFYHFFDLKLSPSHWDYPDHLSTELEFMGYLASAEAQAGEEGATPYRLAQRDFLNRHLGVWLSLLQRGLERDMRNSIYYQLFLGLIKFIRAEQARLEGCVQGGEQ